MIRYMCGACGVVYNSSEYRALDMQLLDEDNPSAGNESVCRECGAGMVSDRFQIRETVDGITISTVALLIGHGAGGRQWYETCLFHEDGTSRVIERYETETDAAHGHALYVREAAENKLVVEP